MLRHSPAARLVSMLVVAHFITYCNSYEYKSLVFISYIFCFSHSKGLSFKRARQSLAASPVSMVVVAHFITYCNWYVNKTSVFISSISCFSHLEFSKEYANHLLPVIFRYWRLHILAITVIVMWIKHLLSFQKFLFYLQHFSLSTNIYPTLL